MSKTDAPLQGLKVIEMARILAGPWAGQTLADLGAEVIKIESPAGDDTRSWGPPWIETETGEKTAAYFHVTNRGKRSLAIDFSDPDQRDKLLALIADADVLIENYKVGGLKKYGLDYDSLHARFPRLIYCSVTGFGQTGPYAHRAGYDVMIQGMSGVMDITGAADGPPQKMGVAFADIFTGLYATIAIQAALAQREKTGKGQQIDMALLDCMVGVLGNQAMNAMVTGQTPKRMGNVHPNLVPYQDFPVSDGHIIIACGNDRQFIKLCEVLGLSQETQKRFDTNPKRVAGHAELVEEISKASIQHSQSTLLKRLEAAGIPAGPINSISEALSDPQIVHRGLVDLSGPAPKLLIPIKFSDSSFENTAPAPDLDELSGKR